ncbi:MAG: fatty-acyl-CoA synthase, partial [Myxococcota bacterium]
AGRIVPGDCLELVSVGPPLPGYQVEVRDDDGAVLPEREVGRIWVSGPSLMRGYLNGIQSPIHKGWLDTGDRGAIDASELFITGREKDVVILRGQNHLPFDIESALDDVQGIRKGCVAAVGDVDETGERLVIFFETREPTEEMVDQCRRAVRARTGLDPAELVPLDPGTLPRTSSGKIRRRAALERWRGGTLTAPRKVTRTLLAAELAKNLVSGVRARWST